MYRFIIFSILIGLLVGCKDNNNGNTVTNKKEEIGSIWKLSEPTGLYGIYIEIKNSKVFEYKTIHAGALCRESKEIKNMRILYGDPDVDDVIGVEYVNDLGITISVEINKQAADVFELKPLCNNDSIWNGVYKKSGSNNLPKYYWVIKVPKTTGYFWDNVARCYSTIDLVEWRMTTLAIMPEGIFFDAIYVVDKMSYVVYMEKVTSGKTKFTPVCRIQ